MAESMTPESSIVHGPSEARRMLSEMTEEFGQDGILIVRKAPGAWVGDEGAELAPKSALDWPPCECGHPKCPDRRTPDRKTSEDAAGPGA